MTDCPQPMKQDYYTAKLRRGRACADWSVKIAIFFALLWLIGSALERSIRTDIAEIGRTVTATYDHPRPRATLGIDTGTIAEWTPETERRKP